MTPHTVTPMTPEDLEWMRARVEDRCDVGEEARLLATIAARDEEIARLEAALYGHIALLTDKKVGR